MIRRLAIAANPASGESPDQLLPRHLDVKHSVYALILRSQGCLQRLSLLQGSREAIQNETLATIGCGDTFQNHFNRHLIGNQEASLHIRPGDIPQLRSTVLCLSKKITGCDMSQPQAFRDYLCLSSLACPGGTKKNDVHCNYSTSIIIIAVHGLRFTVHGSTLNLEL